MHPYHANLAMSTSLTIPHHLSAARPLKLHRNLESGCAQLRAAIADSPGAGGELASEHLLCLEHEISRLDAAQVTDYTDALCHRLSTLCQTAARSLSAAAGRMVEPEEAKHTQDLSTRFLSLVPMALKDYEYTLRKRIAIRCHGEACE